MIRRQKRMANRRNIVMSKRYSSLKGFLLAILGLVLILITIWFICRFGMISLHYGAPSFVLTTLYQYMKKFKVPIYTWIYIPMMQCLQIIDNIFFFPLLQKDCTDNIIEFQRRGFPYAHILVWLREGGLQIGTDVIDFFSFLRKSQIMFLIP